MSNLRNLELKKLLKELEFTQIEFDYKTELLVEVDREFNDEIINFLEKNPDVSEVYYKKSNDRIQTAIDNKFSESFRIESEVDGDIESSQNTQIVTSPKVKKLYREIVKVTHPDSINKKNLNEIYLNATKYYNLNDKIAIYRICSELNIEYEMDEDDEFEIKSKINEIRSRSFFLETTYAWKWYQSKTEVEKNRVMIDFIRMRILN